MSALHDLVKREKERASGTNLCRDSGEVVSAPRGDYAARLRALGLRRWRVLEDARTQKRRLNPDRVQCRDVRKLNGEDWSGDKGGSDSVMIVTSSNESNRAFVMRLLSVPMDALVQLRGDRKNECARKRDDQCTAGECSPHCEATLPPVLNMRKSFLHDRHLHQQVVAALVPSADLVYQSANAQC